MKPKFPVENVYRLQLLTSKSNAVPLLNTPDRYCI